MQSDSTVACFDGIEDRIGETLGSDLRIEYRTNTPRSAKAAFVVSIFF